MFHFRVIAIGGPLDFLQTLATPSEFAIPASLNSEPELLATFPSVTENICDGKSLLIWVGFQDVKPKPVQLDNDKSKNPLNGQDVYNLLKIIHIVVDIIYVFRD